jgi:hypothetical protein
MQRYTVTRYTYDELGPEAQEKALEWWREQKWADDSSWWLTPMLQEHLSDALGSESQDLKLYYSLSYSQGDGVAIEGRLTPADAPLLSWPEGAAYAYLKHSGHYYHEYSFSVNLESDEGDDVAGDAADIFTQQLRDICKDLESVGYKAIEADLADDSILEDIRANTEDDWTAEGKLSRVTEPQDVMA